MTAEFRILSPTDRKQGRVVMTPDLLELDWNTTALYPAGIFARDIPVQASIVLPEKFKFSTALSVAKHSGNTVIFKALDFENLVDSPLFAGRYYKRIDLAPSAAVPVHLDVFADAPKYLHTTPEQVQAHRKLVTQMIKRYGDSQHYDHYDFLLALSDNLSRIGLEHHRSSENILPPGYFRDWQTNWPERDLLPHEYSHSWDGKYRRPARLWTPNFNEPKHDHGLWVYEGFTHYSGYVTAARSGLWSKNEALERLATVGGEYDQGRPGIQWRNIWDTTNDPIIAGHSPSAYPGYQMSQAYYTGGLLIWLAVDAKIRALTHDKTSLTDWSKTFFG